MRSAQESWTVFELVWARSKPHWWAGPICVSMYYCYYARWVAVWGEWEDGEQHAAFSRLRVSASSQAHELIELSTIAGAGAQHAAAVSAHLDMSTLVRPPSLFPQSSRLALVRQSNTASASGVLAGVVHPAETVVAPYNEVTSVVRCCTQGPGRSLSAQVVNAFARRLDLRWAGHSPIHRMHRVMCVVCRRAQ